MAVQAWMTLAILLLLVTLLVREALPPAVAVLGATVALLLLGIVTPAQAFSGFSNEAPFVVGALLVLARAADHSGLVQQAVHRLLRAKSSERGILARLAFPVAALSAFLNNTAIVAMTVPAVLDFARRRGVSPSRFLMPVSYAAVLGGVVTTIGTSTNLTVSGLLQAQGMRPFDLFEITPVGLPIALAGTLLIVALTSWLLPTRRSTRDQFDAPTREFLVSMRVVTGGPLDGRSVKAAGLRNLQGVFLVEIERDHRTLAPVAPEEMLAGEDVLTFAGRVDQVVDLHRMPGLASDEGRHIDALAGGGHGFFEVVVGSELGIAGRTLKQVGFRRRFGAAVLAIHRASAPINAKLGEVRLRLGDTLLVLADPGFRERWHDSREFLLIAPLRGTPPGHPRKALLVAAIGVGFLIAAATGLMPILNASLLAAALVVASGVLSIRQARDAVDFSILILIAASFGLGAAVQASGLGGSIAQGLVDLSQPFGPLGALGAVLVATMILTEAVSNNAAAALMFPIALATASAVGADPRPFVIGVTLGASLSFLTPIGYQTNLMVYGLGGYRFTDYPRLGLPLNVASIVLCLVLIPVVFPL